MEFLKDCATNILTTGDFSTIGYWIGSVNSNLESPETVVNEFSFNSYANVILFTLLNKKVLAALDRDQNEIWIFAGGGKSEIQQDEAQNLAQSKGLSLRTIHIGELQASELCEPSSSGVFTSAPSTPLSASTPTSIGRHQQSLSTRPSKPTVSVNSYDKVTKIMDTFEPNRIYRMFITAVLSLTAYALASTQTAIPLGYREFLSLPYDMGSSQQYFDQSHDFYKSIIYVQLTLRGHLILSFSSKTNSKWRCMSSTHGKAQLSTGTVRLAPRGVIASLLHVEASRGENLTSIKDDPSTQRSLKRWSDIMKWKRRVSSWLHERGLQIRKPDSECCWLWVELPRFTSYLDDSCQLSRSRRFLWPAQFCFYLVGGGSEGSKDMITAQNRSCFAKFDTDTHERLDTLQGKPIEKRSDSFPSSLQLAEEFLLNTISAEPQRDDDAYESFSAELSSPAQTRFAQNADIQLPNGVYPTPPDCVTCPPTSLTEISNTTTAMGDSSTRSEVESPDSEVQSHKRAGNPSNASTDGDDGSNAFEDMETSENELFGETDRDEIEANGITDADFNFFDEPDADMNNYTDKISLGDNGLGTQLEPNLEFAADTLSKKGHQDMNTPGNDNPESFVDEARLPTSFRNAPSRNEIIFSPTGAKAEDNVSQNVVHLPQEDSGTAKSAFISDIPQYNMISSFKRGSLFDPMRFGRKMTISDAKYHAEGRYDFNNKNNMQKEDKNIIHTSLAATTSNTAATKTFLLESQCISPSKEIAGALRLPLAKLSQSSDNETFQSNVSSRLTSEASDSENGENTKSLTLDENSPPHFRLQGLTQEVSTNQSYPQDSAIIHDNMKLETFDSLDAIEGILDALQPVFDEDFNAAVSNIPATTFKDLVHQTLIQQHAGENSVGSNYENISRVSSYSDALAQSTMQSIQILVDQIAKGIWDVPQGTGHPPVHPSKVDIIASDRIEDRLLLAVKHYALPMAKDCGIVQFANLDQFPSESTQFQKFQGRSFTRRSSTENQINNTISTHVHQMPATLLRLRRYNSLLELSPSSLAFWEELGLAPASGSKNLHVYCVYPESEKSRELIDNFLTIMTVVYESSKLGAHARGSDFNRYKDGIIPLQVTTKDEASYKITDLQETFDSLGRELADVYSTDEKSFLDHTSNIVLYVIYPLDEKTSLWQICSSFLRLQEKFQQSRSLSTYTHYAINITLQLTPSNLIASYSELLALQSHHYMRFACEVYDRCQPTSPIKNNMGFDIFCAPSLLLAESLPKSIPFRLSPDPPSDLLNETACMHIAYAKSVDGRWIMAAWTDNSGKRQAHVTYNLEGNQSFNDIAKEMWQTTLEVIQRRRVTWKVIIVAVMEMAREDLDVWIALVTVPTQPVIFTLLLSIGLDFPMRLSAKDLAEDGYDTSFPEQTMYSLDSDVKQAEVGNLTPTNTLNAETIATSPTVSGGNLIDINDETWAIILAHRSNVSTNLSEYRSSLASGLLVKRLEDNSYHPSPLPIHEEIRGPFCVALDLLRICNSSGNGSNNGSNSAVASSALHILGPRGCDHMLREILFMYGSLGLLAKYRGMRDTRGGLIPWHVVMVTRGIKVLENCLS